MERVSKASFQKRYFKSVIAGTVMDDNRGERIAVALQV
jgi:hypothetical protein